jgi:hypothetical protein
MKNFLFNLKYFILNITLVCVSQISKVSKDNYKYAFIIPFILNNFNPENNSDNPDPFLKFAFTMVLLSTILLACFINISGYMISIYLIKKYDLSEENKYPK